MESSFIPYELAVKLKELGFNENCLGYYGCWGEPTKKYKKEYDVRLEFKSGNYSFFYEEFCLAPLWQQAFDWFRNEYNLYADIYRTDKVFSANIEDMLMCNSLCEVVKEVGYEEARLACLEKLIELCTKK